LSCNNCHENQTVFAQDFVDLLLCDVKITQSRGLVNRFGVPNRVLRCFTIVRAGLGLISGWALGCFCGFRVSGASFGF
jgi:hypothetical protein